MPTPDVSVIVTVFNKEDYLSECIDSLISQTLRNVEIVIVNDGSTDRSLQIMSDYARKHEQIRIVNQENQGLTGARIAGFLASAGKYIAWVDADDFVKPEMYEVLYRLAEENQADLVYCDYEYYPHKVAAKAKWFREYEGKRDWHFLDKNTAFWNKMFRKDLLERVNIVDLLNQYGEYSPIVPMLEAEKICFTREQLYVYRVGHESMSGGSFDGKVQHYVKGAVRSKDLKGMIEGKPYEKDLEEYFDYRYIYTLILLAIVSAKNSDKDNYRFAGSELKRMKYTGNRYLNVIVREHYGTVKSLVMTRIMPLNYQLARVIAHFAL